MSANKAPQDNVQIIQVPNTLRAKIGPGTGIDKELVRKADQAIAAKVDDFLERTRGDIQFADQKTTELEDSPDQQNREAIQQELYALNHELRGEAGSYGYHLISKVAKSHCRYIESLPAQATANPAVVRAHTDALRAILAGGIEGDGGAVGNELMESLALLVAKLTNTKK